MIDALVRVQKTGIHLVDATPAPPPPRVHSCSFQGSQFDLKKRILFLIDNLSGFGIIDTRNQPNAVMNSKLKRYLATIGKRGGSATSPKKGSAVRINGTKGGRPRKDGMPPGSMPLEDVMEWIETSRLTRKAMRDLSLWARSTARLFKDRQPWLNREEVIRVRSMVEPRS